MFGVANNLNNYIKTNKIIRNAGTSASFLLFVFALLASFPIVSHTDIVEAASPLESETTIAMNIDKGSANLSLIPKDTSGTFASSSSGDLAEFNVTTNNYTGYTLGIEATDDAGNLTNTDASANNTLSSIPSIIDGATFDTFAYNNQWGYKPSKYNSVDNIAFHPAPTTDGSILDVTDSASSTNGNTYTIGLGARVDYTKPAGTYSNTFILTAVGNPVAYVINYTDISGDTDVTNMPDTDSATSASTKVPLSTRIPVRGSKYTFAGWCDDEPTINADGSSTCNGTVYQPSTESAPSYVDFINQTTELSSMTLYATWNINSYLQTVEVRYQNTDGSWTNYEIYDACTKTITYGETHSCSIDVTDEYQAATLAPYTVTGEATKQISIERNTRTVSLTRGTGISSVSVTGSGVKSGSGTASATVYYGGAVTIAATLSSGYDWVNWTGSATYTSQSQAISSVTSNLSFTANGKLSCQNFGSTTMQAFDPSKLCSGQGTSGTLTDSRDNQSYSVVKLGDGKWWMTRNLAIGCAGSGSSYSSSRKNASLSSSNSNVSSYTINTTNVGNLTDDDSGSFTKAYMQCSATYGAWYNYMAATAGTISGSSNTTEATSDICPKGWRLPTRAEQQAITGYTTAFSPVTGGYYYKGSLTYTGSGYWWSSTAFDFDYRYYLYYDGSSLGTSSNYRRLGIYVRCVRAS